MQRFLMVYNTLDKEVNISLQNSFQFTLAPSLSEEKIKNKKKRKRKKKEKKKKKKKKKSLFLFFLVIYLLNFVITMIASIFHIISLLQTKLNNISLGMVIPDLVYLFIYFPDLQQRNGLLVQIWCYSAETVM